MSTQTASPDTDTAFDEIVGRRPDEDDGSSGDHDRFSHYADKEDIIRAATQGVAIIAICGKKWKPQANPQNFPVCPTCQEIYDQLPTGE